MTYTSTIFTQLGKIIETIANAISATDISTQVSQINALILAWFTLYVIAKGYMVLAGKSDDPVKDLLFRLSLYAIIVAFATNAGGWLTLVNNAINGLNEWAGFGGSLFSKLDIVFGKAIEVGVMLEEQEKETLSVVNMAGILANAVVLIGFIFFAVPAVGIIITTTFILKILILIAPIMIFTLLFDWVKGIFQKWIELIISNTLTVFLVGISFAGLINVYNGQMTSASGQAKAIGENGLALSFEIFILSLVFMILIIMARGIAQQLTYVSIESLPGSASKSAARGVGATRGGIEKAHGDIRSTGARVKQRAARASKTMKNGR